jgi:hypothetical protein
MKEKAGRNDPCPCGSGKKFKKCCGVLPVKRFSAQIIEEETKVQKIASMMSLGRLKSQPSEESQP